MTFIGIDFGTEPHPTAVVDLDVIFEEAAQVVAAVVGHCGTWDALRAGWLAAAGETVSCLLADASHAAAEGACARPRGRVGGK